MKLRDLLSKLLIISCLWSPKISEAAYSDTFFLLVLALYPLKEKEDFKDYDHSEYARFGLAYRLEEALTDPVHQLREKLSGQFVHCPECLDLIVATILWWYFATTEIDFTDKTLGQKFVDMINKDTKHLAFKDNQLDHEVLTIRSLNIQFPILEDYLKENLARLKDIRSWRQREEKIFHLESPKQIPFERLSFDLDATMNLLKQTGYTRGKVPYIRYLLLMSYAYHWLQAVDFESNIYTLADADNLLQFLESFGIGQERLANIHLPLLQKSMPSSFKEALTFEDEVTVRIPVLITHPILMRAVYKFALGIDTLRSNLRYGHDDQETWISVAKKPKEPDPPDIQDLEVKQLNIFE